MAISDRTAETVAKAIFTRWICRYGVPTEIITNREKEFCNEITVELYKAMKLNPDSGCQFPTFFCQEKTANRKIDNYLKQIFELTTTDWEIYLAPLMFSYNTSFNRTFQTSPHFVMFGQHASQPAFNHGNWVKKNLGESPAAEKYQTLQAARQVAWQNVAHQQQMNFKIYEYQSASHLIYPQSNTDFTQVTCTVHFYYKILSYEIYIQAVFITDKKDKFYGPTYEMPPGVTMTADLVKQINTYFESNKPTGIVTTPVFFDWVDLQFDSVTDKTFDEYYRSMAQVYYGEEFDAAKHFNALPHSARKVF